MWYPHINECPLSSYVVRASQLGDGVPSVFSACIWVSSVKLRC